MRYLQVTGIEILTSGFMATVNQKGEIKEANCKQERLAIRDTLDLLGGKWSIRIIRYLNEMAKETNTFKKIQGNIDSISSKILSQELIKLETNKLIIRTVLNTRPIKVQYEISSYGKSVLPLAENLAQWGLDHREHIR